MTFVIHNVIHNAKLWPFVIHSSWKRSQFCIINDIVYNKKGHNLVNNIMNNIMKDKKGHNIVNNIMNNIMKDKKGHNIVNDINERHCEPQTALLISHLYQ